MRLFRRVAVSEKSILVENIDDEPIQKKSQVKRKSSLFQRPSSFSLVEKVKAPLSLVEKVKVQYWSWKYKGQSISLHQFGKGIILNYRNVDKVYTILLPTGVTMYCRKMDTLPLHENYSFIIHEKYGIGYFVKRWKGYCMVYLFNLKIIGYFHVQSIKTLPNSHILLPDTPFGRITNVTHCDKTYVQGKVKNLDCYVSMKHLTNVAVRKSTMFKTFKNRFTTSA